MGKKVGREITPILRAGIWTRFAGFAPLETKVSFSWRRTNGNFLAGFTFIELLIVLLILSVSLLIVLPNFRNILPGTHLSSSARYVAAAISWLYHEAGLSGRKCRLNLDLDEDEYWFEKEAAEGEMEKLEGNLQGVRRLLQGVSFRDVVTETKKVEEGEVYIDFSPYGFVEPAIIHLVNSEGEQLSITINSFTGRAEIQEGYVEEKAGE